MCKTIKQKVKFAARPMEIYELLTDSKKHQAFSGKRANLGKKIGDKFSVAGASGIIVDLETGVRVVQAWHGQKFPRGIFSMATFNLSRTKSGGTELVLTHRGVPKDLIPEIEDQWRTNYWKKIKDYLAE